MQFEALVKQGHAGAGKYLERKIYMTAANIIEALDIAKAKGGVKKGGLFNSGASVLNIKMLKN